jgi:hypothetical protein
LGFAVLEPGRLVKLKEAFKVATSVSDIKVKDAKVVTNKQYYLVKGKITWFSLFFIHMANFQQQIEKQNN